MANDLSPNIPNNMIADAGLPQPRRFWAMLTVLVAVAMATLDTAIANMALPTISADLNVSAAAAVWVITSYQLVMVATLLPFATLGEIWGHRTVYIVGIAIFTLASLLCALSSSLLSLCIARAFQGIGASAIMSVNTALVRTIYPARFLGRGTGLTALVVAVSFALGPTVAAAILEVAPSWVWLFAINVPFGLAALALAVPALPPNERRAGRFDFTGAFLNAGVFGLLILALGEGTHHASPAEIFGEIAVAAALGFVLLRYQSGKDSPVFPTDLFRIRNFALSALTAFCAFAAQGLAFVSLPFLLQVNLHLSNSQTGLLLTPWPFTVAIMGIVAGRLSDRHPAGILGAIGLAILASGLLLTAALPSDGAGFPIIWRLAVCGLGFGFFQAPNMRALMLSAPAERSGGASGIVAMARLSGQATGAALAALGFGVYGAEGPFVALAIGAFFAAAGAVASVLRVPSTQIKAQT